MSDDDTRPVSKVARRTLIAGAAWAVPTVAVLSATPAFAASSSLTKVAITVPSPQANSWNDGKVHLNYAAVSYDPNAWGVSPYPTTATVIWSVVVKNAAGTVVATLVDSRTAALGAWDRDSVASGSAALGSGTYTVVTELVSVTFVPATVNAVTFHNSSVSPSTTVVIP